MTTTPDAIAYPTAPATRPVRSARRRPAWSWLAVGAGVAASAALAASVLGTEAATPARPAEAQVVDARHPADLSAEVGSINALDHALTTRRVDPAAAAAACGSIAALDHAAATGRGDERCSP